MAIIKEVREFFLRHVKVLSGNKRDRESNFPTTYITKDALGNLVQAYNRFLKHDYPSEEVFAKLLESITFKLNPEDAATLTAQGLVRMATTAEINAGTNTDSNLYTLAVKPSDIKTIIDNLSALTDIVEANKKIYFLNTLPTTGTYNLGDIVIITDEESTVYSRIYECTALTPLSWTIKANKNVIPKGGTNGQVLEKNGISNYAALWATPALPNNARIFIGSINQSGTAAPVLTTVYSTFGGLTIGYIETGYYSISDSVTPLTAKTFVTITKQDKLNKGMYYRLATNNPSMTAIEINTYDMEEVGGALVITPEDNILTFGHIIIISLPL